MPYRAPVIQNQKGLVALITGRPRDGILPVRRPTKSMVPSKSGMDRNAQLPRSARQSRDHEPVIIASAPGKAAIPT